jgi:hypothetical protein
MFDFCVRGLGFSEGEAFRRLTAARLVHRFPSIVGALEAGRVHLSSVVLLRDHFTEGNVEGLLASAAGRSKREVQELVARLAPRPDVAPSIRKLPNAAPVGTTSGAMPPSRSPSPADKPQVEPLSESRYRVQLTASASLRDKLEHACALMSHRNRNGDLAVVVDAALDLLIEKLEKERFGKTARPRKAKPPADPGHVTRAARREVAERDGMQCSFVRADGVRCTARYFLEYDHLHPRALGGVGDAANGRLVCAAHNHLAAEKAFGRDFMAARINVRQRKCGRSVETPSSETRGSTEPGDPKGLLQSALRSLGFASGEVARATVALGSHGWDRPAESLLREALGVLT